jgi:uncharacterized protein (DUF427 family)
VTFAGELIADSQAAYRVLETSHPPVYYLPPADLRMEFLERTSGSSFCEFKGLASYWSIRVGEKVSERAAWSYDDPTAAFAGIAGYLAFYASKVDRCMVGDEEVLAQAGDFYGGWITSKIVGPFKGEPGTMGW